MKLPTLSNRGAVPQNLNDRIGRLRAATGKAERCEMQLFCSSDPAMPSFGCSFERMHPGDQFKLVHQTGPTGSGGSGGGLAKAATYRADEFAPFATVCPHCGDRGRIGCQGCGRTYCQGAVTRESGGEVFRCPTCKNVGKVTAGDGGGTVQVVRSATPERPAAGLLGHVRQGLLPGRK